MLARMDNMGIVAEQFGDLGELDDLGPSSKDDRDRPMIGVS